MKPSRGMMLGGNSGQTYARNPIMSTPNDPTPSVAAAVAAVAAATGTNINTNNNNNNNNNNSNNSNDTNSSGDNSFNMLTTATTTTTTSDNNSNNNNNHSNNNNNNNNNNHNSDSQRKSYVYLLRQQKRVYLTLETIERNLNGFKSKWFPHSQHMSHDELVYWAEALCSGSPLRGSLVPKEFLLQLESRSSWRKLPHTATTELKKVFTRAKLFDKLISNSITDLQRIFKDYLNKHCLSFLSEGDPAGLKTPTLYENNIQKWRQEIQNEYTILQCQLAELQDLGISLPHYVDSIDRVTQVMSEVLDFLPHIVDLIKLWLSEEEVYLKKIDDELGSLLRQKARCGKALRRQHSAMQDMRSDYQQQKFIGQRLWQGVKAAMQDKKQLEQQEAGLKNSLNITESELSLMKNSRSDAEMQFQSRHVNKPGPTATSLFEHWTDFIEKQEQDICQLRLRRDRVKVEWSRLIKSKYYCQRKLDEAQSKYQSCKKVLDQIEGKLQKEEEDYLRLERDLEILAAKVGTMERIKEQKIQTHTIETMFTKPKMTTTTTTTTTATAAATTTNTEHEQDFESVFDKVCSLVAAEIGKDWVCLYKILPFRPTRDIRSRMRDIETIEHQCQLAADQGTKDMAYQALHKWKLFSDHSSIRSLTNALQRLNKSEILMMMKKNKYIAAK